MRIPRPIYEEMVAHARDEAPNECCGMVGGSGGEAKTLYRATNSEASPLRYNLEPKDQFRIMREMEERGEELAAIYHSHTHSPAYPSQTDINLAFWELRSDGKVERTLAWPGAIYLIVSLLEGEEPIRGFEITEDAEVIESDLIIE
jgi:[CysO sulfur-carrier protein]-S-L-cysteine hydrolase